MRAQTSNPVLSRVPVDLNFPLHSELVPRRQRTHGSDVSGTNGTVGIADASNAKSSWSVAKNGDTARKAGVGSASESIQIDARVLEMNLTVTMQNFVHSD